MKVLDSIETKKLAHDQFVSKWQIWDSLWGSHNSTPEILNILKHCLVESAARKARKRVWVLNHWTNVTAVLN